MSFIDKVFGSNNKSKNENPMLKKARIIAERLGKTEEIPLYDSGKSYKYDRTYKGYGLEIVKQGQCRSENRDVYVNYNNQRVLDKNIYISGPWEGILSELYKSIDAILAEREAKRKQVEEAQAKEREIVYALGNITRQTKTINLKNGIRIESTECTGVTYEEYSGTRYKVYQNEKLVFNGAIGFSLYEGYKRYVPGSWEDEIKKYAAKKERQRGQEEYNKLTEDANQKIKQLRKIRGE